MHVIYSLMAVVGMALLGAASQSVQEPGQVSAPAGKRSVRGQALTSDAKPAIRLTFDKTFKYVGSQEFILYKVARAEQHFFVDADKQGHIRRLYWIQFEGYLPDNKYTYRYKETKVVDHGGLKWIADAYPRNVKASPPRPDSDSARARTFLESKGYHMASDDVMSQRLVHLVDETKRDELMVIYTEDLTPTGLTAADLSDKGRAADKWEEMSKGLLERALKGMRVGKK